MIVQRRKTRTLGYADVYEAYLAAGWTPVPLPRGRKKNPPPDVTGNKPNRHDPGPRDYRRWASEFADGNLAIVMPEGVIGLDVDVYHGGGETLDRLAAKYGDDLPVTWESTSREDWSGIALYRVPPGTRLESQVKSGIEVLQWWHRYAICWPSIHPEGRIYRWWTGTELAAIPAVADLPWLPDRWVKGLAAGERKALSGTPYNGDVGDWLDELPDGWTPPRAQKVLRVAGRKFRDGSCRHDAMVEATGALVHLGAGGKPVRGALDELADLFCAAVAGDRDGTEEYEYWSAVETAIRKFGGRKRRLWRDRGPVLTDAEVTALVDTPVLTNAEMDAIIDAPSVLTEAEEQALVDGGASW